MLITLSRNRVLLVIICGAFSLTLGMGIRQGLGLFLKPISLDLGFGREVFAFAIAIQNLMWGAASPFLGALADRYGPGRTVAVAGLGYVLGLAIMGHSVSANELILGNFLVGFGLAGVTFGPVLGAVGRVVAPEHRSMALGITSAGGSLGQFAVVPISHTLLTTYGWSLALICLAAIAFIMVPLAAGLAGTAAPAQERSKQSLGAALGEAGGHGGFWLLNAGFFVCGFHVTFVSTHLPAFLADRGLPSWLGAASLSLVGLFNIFGTFLAGWAGGRYRKKYVLSLIYLARAFVFLGIMLVPLNEATVLTFAAACGFLWLGTVPLTSGLVAQIFGSTYLSTLWGIVFFSHQVGAFFGAWLGGYAYDLTGSYDVMWLLSVLLGVASAILHWPIADRPMSRLAPAQ